MDEKTKETEKVLINFKDWLIDQGLKYHPIIYIDSYLIEEYLKFIKGDTLF